MKLYWNSFKPFWAELDNNYLREHIEDYLTNNGYNWVLFQNGKFQWINGGISLTTNLDNINYLKLEAEEGIFYFYKKTIPLEPSSSEPFDIREYFYVLDLYNTIFREIFLFFERENVDVFAVRGFLNRFNYTLNGQTIAANFNISIMKYLGQVIPSNHSFLKRYIMGTDPDKLCKINNVKDNFYFAPYITNNTGISFSKTDLNTPNNKNKFTYLKTNNTAFVANLDRSKEYIAKTMDINTGYDLLFIIPNVERSNTTGNDSIYYYDPKLFYKFLYPSVKQLELLDTDFINPSGDNFIAIYDRDVPYSVICDKFQDGLFNAVIHLYQRNGYDDRINTEYTHNYIYIPFIKLPFNTSLDVKLYEYKQLNDNIFGKLINAIQSLDKWSPETEPYLLNPYFYKEEISLDNGKVLSVDVSLLNLEIDDIFTTDAIEIYLNSKIIFDQNGIMIYDLGLNTNRFNIWWNNYFNNCRFNDCSEIGFKSPALAAYAVNNVTSIYTSHANLTDAISHRKSDQILDLTDRWINFTLQSLETGIDIAANVLTLGKTRSSVSKIKMRRNMANEAVGWVSDLSSNIIDTISEVKNNMYQTTLDLRKYSSQIVNITSSSPENLSVPFLTSYYENISYNGDYLFTTWCNELHNVDKLNVFNDIINNGYYINSFLKIKDLHNRKFMNYYMIDWNKNRSYLWTVFQKFTFNDYFNNNYWFELFIAYFNNVRIWEQNIVNCINYGYVNNNKIIMDDDYVNNYELILDRLISHALVNTDLNDIDLSPYHFWNKPLNNILNFIKNLTSFTDWDYISVTVEKNFIKFTGDGNNYFGTIIKNYSYDGELNENDFYNDITTFYFNNDDYIKDPFIYLLLDDVSIIQYIKNIIIKNSPVLWDNIGDYIEIDDYITHNDYTHVQNTFSDVIIYDDHNNKIIPHYSWFVPFIVSLRLNVDNFNKETYIITPRTLKRLFLERFWLKSEHLNNFYIGTYFTNNDMGNINLYPNFKLFLNGEYTSFSIKINNDNWSYTGIKGLKNWNYNHYINSCSWTSLGVGLVRSTESYIFNGSTIIYAGFIKMYAGFAFNITFDDSIMSRLSDVYKIKYNSIIFNNATINDVECVYYLSH